MPTILCNCTSGCCGNRIPCLFVSSVVVNTATNIATLTTSTPLPTTAGRFDLRLGCNVCINPCSAEKVILTDGTNTIQNVLAKCGNFLLLGQIARQVKCNYPLHFNRTYNPEGNAICLDRLILPSTGTPAIGSCGTSVSVVTTTV